MKVFNKLIPIIALCLGFTNLNAQFAQNETVICSPDSIDLFANSNNIGSQTYSMDSIAFNPETPGGLSLFFFDLRVPPMVLFSREQWSHLFT